MTTNNATEKLNIALVQMPIIWHNAKANIAYLDLKLKNCSEDTDVIILPEMFTSGFTMNPEQLEVHEGEQTLAWMKETAIKKNVALLGSIVYKEFSLYYNRLFFVQPNGEYSIYNKRHTFTLAGEHEKYEFGQERILVAYKGFKFCPLICYDLRFPVWSRNTEDYDVLVYVANWPAPRIMAWNALLQARAIENMSYCVGVNRIGTDQEGHSYPGHSAAYDPLGEQIVISTQEEIIEFTISKSTIDKVRHKLPFLKDRDQFNLLP